MSNRATVSLRLLPGDKEPVRLATTGNLTSLSGLLTIDGVVTVAGDRVLVKDQADATTNGIYTASEGTWYRAPDANTERLLQQGMKAYVRLGDENNGLTFYVSSIVDDLGADDVEFDQYSQRYTAADIIDAIADLSFAADKYIYFTDATTPALGTIVAAARALLADPSKLLKSDTHATLTAGFSATSFSGGTKSSGTFTPAAASGGFQHITNGGAFTLAPPTTTTVIILEIVNNGSAGTITTSGFTKVTGDSFTLTNGHKFSCTIQKTQNYSLLSVTALQ